MALLFNNGLFTTKEDGGLPTIPVDPITRTGTKFPRGYYITDPQAIEQFGIIAQASQEAAGIGMPEAPSDIIDDPRNKDLGTEERIFKILYDTIIKEQEVPEGVSPEVLSAITVDYSNANVADLEVLAEEIKEAGGWDEWYAQQQETDLEGPPEELPTELKEDPFEMPDFDVPFIDVDPDMPINIPFPTLPPREGEGEGAGEGEGEGDTGQETTGEIPDYSEIGDPNYGYPGGLPRQGSGGTIDDYRLEEPGFTVGLGIPVLGSLGGGGGGGGGSTTPRQGMFDPRFIPFMTSIGYQPVEVPEAIVPSLFREYFT